MSGFYGLSNKVLEYAEGFTDKENFQELFPLEHFRKTHNSYLGKWECIQDTDELLLNENLKTGQFFNVVLQLFGEGSFKVFLGKFDEANQVIEKLSKIADNYEYKLARQCQLHVEIFLFLCCRELNQAKKTSETYESLFKADTDSFLMMGFLAKKAELQIMLNELNEADRTLNYTEEIIANHMVLPSSLTSYFLSRIRLDVRRIDESIISNNITDLKKYVQQASKSVKKLLRSIKKFAFDRPEALGLIANYYWLIEKQNKAVKFWKEAVEINKRYDLCPSLARTYMEIGKHFLEKKSKYKELNGISAVEYLEKARVMFQEMDLQWDLDELDKITMTR
jgi:tetratricopeptide (TPR) repeat protein